MSFAKSQNSRRPFLASHRWRLPVQAQEPTEGHLQILGPGCLVFEKTKD